MRTPDGKLVEKVRVVAKNRFIWLGKGKTLASEIKYIDPETQQQVPSSEVLEILEHFNYKCLGEDGQLWNEDDLLHYVVQQDGSEKEFTPYSRTDVIDVSVEENWVPSVSVDAFIVHQIYELYTEDKKDAIRLFEEAEKRLRADQVHVATFSFGGTKAYYIFVCPYFRDGKYLWLLKFTEKKPIYNHLQEPPVVPKTPLRETPTLQTLPPVQVLVAVAKKKQNK